MAEQATDGTDASNIARSPAWHNVKLRAADFDYLERSAQQAKLSVAANLQRIIRRDRSVGAVHDLITGLAEQIRLLEKLTQNSASDITARLRRLEAGAAGKRGSDVDVDATPEGIPFEVYDRYLAVITLTLVRDLAEHFVPEHAANAEGRADAEMDRLYRIAHEGATASEAKEGAHAHAK